MFKQSDEVSGEAETIIGPSVKVEGDLNASGGIVIEGSVSGNVTTDNGVTVGDNAVIDADIKAGSATISGTINGGMTISGHLTIQSSAKITGDIKTQTISIESGAQINGMLNMGGGSTPPVSEADPVADESED